MSFRHVISDMKDSPATMAFCLAWLVVFVAMVAQFDFNGPPHHSRWSKLMIGMTNGHPFGDLTIRDLRYGQAWRLVTCTFVHYGLVHLGLNLFAMYQLGAIVESWYGSYQMVLIYALTAGLGNLVSALARMALKYPENVHSGGGSVVILGLVGLCAVVGWRSKTSRGEYLRQQMVTVIALTAILGVGFPLMFKGVGVDNWGHAGGAIVGAVVGFAHPWLVRKPRAFELGILSLILILACGFVQASSERGEALIRNEEASRLRVGQLQETFQILRSIKPFLKSKATATTVVRLLEQLERVLDVPETSAPYRRMLELARRATNAPLDAEEMAEFQTSTSAVEQSVRVSLRQAIDQFNEIRKHNTEIRKRKP